MEKRKTNGKATVSNEKDEGLRLTAALAQKIIVWMTYPIFRIGQLRSETKKKVED